MLKLPDNLTAETFLQQHWQKKELFMPGALPRIRPAITRNELGWLATLDDVESRLVFVDRTGIRPRYRAESGPFDAEYLQKLPKRDWTLLVHDVEKHLPTLRALFQCVPFIPQWRIDDLMVSFAAPGGGVGPHRDHYDVFLCQGIGVRNWRFTKGPVAEDRKASDDLALLCEFDGDEDHDTVQGDVLYLPPGVAHWGTAKQACITYSIGMRAPQAADLSLAVGYKSRDETAFYSDADLCPDEATPGLISGQAARRASELLGLASDRLNDASEALGRFATQPKDWLRPDGAETAEATALLKQMHAGNRLNVHGMALVAFDQQKVYVNGSSRLLPQEVLSFVEEICAKRWISGRIPPNSLQADVLHWMLQRGAFEIPENS